MKPKSNLRMLLIMYGEGNVMMKLKHIFLSYLEVVQELKSLYNVNNHLTNGTFGTFINTSESDKIQVEFPNVEVEFPNVEEVNK